MPAGIDEFFGGRKRGIIVVYQDHLYAIHFIFRDVELSSASVGEMRNTSAEQEWLERLRGRWAWRTVLAKEVAVMVYTGHLMMRFRVIIKPQGEWE